LVGIRCEAWFTDVAEGDIEFASDFLSNEIYRCPDVRIEAQMHTAFERFSERA
jgi:hypothetical protein